MALKSNRKQTLAIEIIALKVWDTNAERPNISLSGFYDQGTNPIFELYKKCMADHFAI